MQNPLCRLGDKKKSILQVMKCANDEEYETVLPRTEVDDSSLCRSR